MNKIKKAVILAAGLGTRMLPLTKAVPKEMLPLGNMPILEHLVRELAGCGINEICIVINKNKKLIIKHFTKNKKLYKLLNNKPDLLRNASDIDSLAKITFVYQKKQNGMASALLSAAKFIGSDSFVMLGGDELFAANATAEMLKVYNNNSLPQFACIEVSDKQVCNYGNIVTKDKNIITEFIEKPKQGQNKGNKIFVCRAIFDKDCFHIIKNETKLNKTESAMQNAYNKMISSLRVEAVLIKSKRYDTGSMKGYFDAFVDFGKKL